LTTDNKRIWYFGDADANERIGLYVDATDYTLSIICLVSGTAQWIITTTETYSENIDYCIVLVQDGTEPKIYTNGKLTSTSFDNSTDKTSWFNSTTGIDNLRIGCSNYNGAANTLFGNITTQYFNAWNYDWTADEVKDFYSGAELPYKYIGASQTEQTSGTLTIGKAYRINDWITDDDFTNIGGTNEDGNEFVATGTTPTTWTNSSTVVPIGCVANYTPEGVGNYTWQDVSGNELNGTVSGANTINLPADDEQIAIKTMVADATMTDAIPADYVLEYIIVENQTAAADTLDFGTTEWDSDIASASVIAASTQTVIVVNQFFDAETDISVSDTNANGWNSNHIVNAILRRVK